jgi:hypothetical protein
MSESLLYGKILETSATHLRHKCVRANASPRIVPRIFKCMSYHVAFLLHQLDVILS